MGKRVVIPEYGDNCSLCFDPGQTPKYIWAAFAGIQTGALWIPPIHPPPNGNFQLEQFAGPCHWMYQGDVWRIEYYAAPFGIPGVASQLTAKYFSPVIGYAFGGQSPDPCVTAFSNMQLPPPPQWWKGGAGWIFW